MRSKAPFARVRNSSGDRFWIGCGTHTTDGSKPMALPCAAAAGLNSSVATTQPGMPRLSRVDMSCKLHDVHEPQSASPPTTMSQDSTMAASTGSAAILVCVALANRMVVMPRASNSACR